MTSHALARSVPLFCAVWFAVAGTTLADPAVSTPDSILAFVPPGNYPLISENSVKVDPIIKLSSFDLTPTGTQRDFPITFDLRDVDGQSYVTPVKSQQGGTCWTHGTMAAIESHTLRAGLPWIAYLPAQTYPCMDEYHLDWWNGFNQYYNADIYPTTGEGLEVHMGGDYLVASAYFARNDGAVDRYLTSGSLYTGTYDSPGPQYSSTYDYYFPREIEWLTSGTELENIDAIKDALQTHGIVATAICWSSSFYNSWTQTFYQPAWNTTLPNHSVAIAGWNDTLATQASERGAWLCKNSWGTGWGQAGYFWVSYYDKVAGHHPEMGAVSFHDIEIVRPRHMYYHDYHGWRDTREEISQALAAFRTANFSMIADVSFITSVDNVLFLVEVYDDFDPVSGPSHLLASVSGTKAHIGLHTVALDREVRLPEGDDFYVAVTLSDGGMAFDRTSLIPVLLGTEDDEVLVRSTSQEEECYYRDGGVWYDLYEDDTTASFCLKAIAGKLSPVRVSSPVGIPPLTTTFSTSWPYGDVLACLWEFDDGTISTDMTPVHSFEELGMHDVAVTLTTSTGDFTCLHKWAIGVEADTLEVAAVAADLGETVRVDITLHNYLPLSSVVLPFNWEGQLDLGFDSVSVAGCRTESFGTLVTHGPVEPERSAAATWEGNAGQCLAPGAGRILSVYFTVQGGTGGTVNPVTIYPYNDWTPMVYAEGLADYTPTLVAGGISLDCCSGLVGDANSSGEDVPTIGDISAMIDAMFITGTCDGILSCPAEADVNQSGGPNPTCVEVTIGDISILIDYLFIHGAYDLVTNPEGVQLPECL